MRPCFEPGHELTRTWSGAIDFAGWSKISIASAMIDVHKFVFTNIRIEVAEKYKSAHHER